MRTVSSRPPIDPTASSAATTSVQDVAPKPGLEPAALPASPDASGDRHLPASRAKWTPLAGIPSLVGKVGVGVAVTGVILGTLLGTPSARTPAPEPAPIVVQADTGSGVGHKLHELSDALRVVTPPGMSRERVLKSVGYIGFSVVAERGLVTDSTSRLEIEPGTKISAYLDRHGVRLEASPKMGWRIDWWPDAELESLTYDFASGKFRAQASGLGPDSWYSSSLEEIATQYLAPQIPEAMRRPGYNPFTDPDLEKNAEQLVDRISAVATHGPGRASPVNLTSLSAPSASIDFTVDEARTIPLGEPAAIGGAKASKGRKYNAWIDAGTRVGISVDAQGKLDDPTLRSLRVELSKPVIIGSGNEKPTFKTMELQTIVLRPNGELDLAYRLGPESAIDGVKALAILAALVSDPRVLNGDVNMRPTHLDGVRADIDKEISTTVRPALVEFLRANDRAIEGVSLVHFFGLSAK